jgi:hypothetical protein
VIVDRLFDHLQRRHCIQFDLRKFTIERAHSRTLAEVRA